MAADASSHGVGAVISHAFADRTEKTTMHTARSLTTAERNYSQVEKEALATIFAAKKFHNMLFGRTFTLLTDHKPLVSIFGSKHDISVYKFGRPYCWGSILTSSTAIQRKLVKQMPYRTSSVHKQC